MKQVFSHPDVEQLELQGYRVISGLLDIYQPLLKLSLEDFSELVAQEGYGGYPLPPGCIRNFQPVTAGLC